MDKECKYEIHVDMLGTLFIVDYKFPTSSRRTCPSWLATPSRSKVPQRSVYKKDVLLRGAILIDGSLHFFKIILTARC